MVRGILYYLVVWIIVSALLHGYNHLSKRERVTVTRSVISGLLTATLALCIVLLIVYLF